MVDSRQRILRPDAPLILAWRKMWCRVALLICAKKSSHFLVGDHGYEKTACLDDRIDARCRYGRLRDVQLVWATFQSGDNARHNL